MKVAIFSESPTDDTAIRILVDAVLGLKTTSVKLPKFKSRGWPAVSRDLPLVYRSVYYNTDAEILVVVVDSNGTTPHESGHPASPAPGWECRLCELRARVLAIQAGLQDVPGRLPFRVALGCAVPAIEAWLLCDRQPHISETTWRQVLAGHSTRYDSRSLKFDLYGSDRPDRDVNLVTTVERATAVASNLDLLRQRFPGGFGALFDSLRQP